MLESAAADDIELGIVAHRALDEPRERRPLELGQVLAGEVADQVGGGIDRPAIDRLHSGTLASIRVSSPVTARRFRECRAPETSSLFVLAPMLATDPELDKRISPGHWAPASCQPTV